MKIFLRSLLLLFILQYSSILSQISGTCTIPGTYSTIAAAITDLNTQGINGPVTINIAANYTETAPAGGYSLYATGTATNPITFAKNGSGANPLITANTTGTAISSSAVQDGIWRLIGCDYITIDGIDLLDPNTTNPATMEFGYGLFKSNITNGCLHNTIKNCVITLNRDNVAPGAGPALEGSRGIDMVNATTSAHTVALVPTTAFGSNSNNKFHSNVIQNCNVGIAVIGYNSPSPYTFADQNNDVGGLSAVTGNTIINFGGGIANTNPPSTGIKTLAQYFLNISYNTLNNNNGNGISHLFQLRGIFTQAAQS